MSDSKPVTSVSAAPGAAAGSTSRTARSDSETPPANPAAGGRSKRASTPRQSPKAAAGDTVTPMEGNVRASADITRRTSVNAATQAVKIDGEVKPPVAAARPKSTKLRTASPKSETASAESTAASAKRKAAKASAVTDSLPDQAQIERMIAEAAYYLAEKRNFAPGWEHEDWLSAKAVVMAELERGVL